MESHPLQEAEDLEAIESYPWPDPKETIVTDGLRERARRLRQETDFAVCGYMGGASIFEQTWYLRSYEGLLIDFMVNKEFAHALLSKVLDVRKKNADIYLSEVGEYLDVFQIGDDIATQENPAMSPVLYREMLKPYHAELFRYIKERTPAKLYYHSCGSVIPLIDDLIEIGVDALNPIQVSAKGMDTAELKRRFGDRIAFWGAIDSQRTLPFGSVDTVRAEVRQRISDLGPGGGYILAGVHNLQPDIPPENIVAMYEEGAAFGKYPLPNGLNTKR
jgi:uroporphyrinogen decarboxylase